MTLEHATLVLAAALLAFEFQNLLGWWRGRVLAPHFERSWDFTVVVPVFGHRRYFEDRGHLLRYKPQTLVSLDVGAPGMSEFADELEREGWRVARLRTSSPSPPAMIAGALPLVRSTYLVRVDADTRILDDLPRYVAAMERDRADVASTKVEVASPSSTPERFQQLEYRMAMLSRRFRPWLTSGACTVARTDAWRWIFERHSMWFPGEDIETGRVALALRLRVRHLDMRVATAAPSTWRGLYRQRKLWWAGSFRHTVVNLDKNLAQLPGVSFYYVGLVWIGAYFKWELITGALRPLFALQTLVALFAVYAAIIVLANLPVASWRMLVYPPYALAQAALMPVVGAAYYIVLARRQGRLGRYRIGYLPRRAAS